MNRTRWAVAASLLVTTGLGGGLLLNELARTGRMSPGQGEADAGRPLGAAPSGPGPQAPAAAKPDVAIPAEARRAQAAEQREADLRARLDATRDTQARAEAAATAAPRAPVATQPSIAIAPAPSAGAQLAPDGAPPRRVAPQTAPPLPALPPARDLPAPAEPAGRDRFAGAEANPFRVAREEPVSTFSVDVDTASYSFTRSSLSRGVLPPPAAVRTEELVNYFPYAYPAPADAREPFRVTASVFPSPWNEGRQIVHVGLKGHALKPAERPPANLVFLVDVSGSMNAPNRLPLARQALAMLVEQLGPRDRVAIVTYAGRAGTVLEPTPASDKARILAAIEGLGAGGSTAGAEGIRQAYALAEAGFDPKAVNRVMIATDGDFNVGITDRDELKGFVERKREKGIFLSVLGFGMGNYNDALMQALAQNGNGAAAYIDTLSEARKVLVEEATSTIVPIATDVKVQVEFNPAAVSEYRLVGYETRALRREDFNNDRVDAGDVGSGHTVTALYEIVPAGGRRVSDDLRYGAPSPGPAAPAEELAFVKLRYKLPGAAASELMTLPVRRAEAAAAFDQAPQEARFAVSVAGFAELLRGGRHTGRLTYDDVIRQALAAKGEDPFGYRSEFVQMVRAAKAAAAMQPAPR